MQSDVKFIQNNNEANDSTEKKCVIFVLRTTMWIIDHSDGCNLHQMINQKCSDRYFFKTSPDKDALHDNTMQE